MNGARNDRAGADPPGCVKLFPVAGALLLPHRTLPLNVFEPRYCAMVDAALAADRLIGMIQPRAHRPRAMEPHARLPAAQSDEAHPPLFSVGCVGRITQFAETDAGGYLIVLLGLRRFRLIGEKPVDTPFRQGRVAFDDFADNLTEDPAAIDRSALLTALRKFAAWAHYELDWDRLSQAPTAALVDALSIASPFGPQEKQALLEARTTDARARTLIMLAEVAMAERPHRAPILQ